MEKSDLMPGMKVINIISGKQGTVMGRPDGTLTCIEGYIKVRIKEPKKRPQFPIWAVRNLVKA